MRRHEGTIRMLAMAAVAFLVNLILDVTLEMPMLVRWGIAVAVVLVLTLMVESLRRRRGPARDTDQGRT